MIAALRQPPPLNRPLPALDARIDSPLSMLGTRAPQLIAGLYGFCAFLPYPSISVGSNSAIQIGNLLTLALCPLLLCTGWRNKPYWMAPLHIAPMILSTAMLGFTGGDIDPSFKTFITYSLAALTLLATQLLGPKLFFDLLIGVTVAAILHGMIGFWQLLAFNAGYFPLQSLYVNQSFLSIQDNVDIIVQYIQRPFGLFPEPSAMSASLAPFVLLWAALLGGLVKLRTQPPRWMMATFTVAAALSLGLMIISRSGHTAITLAAGSVLAAIWLKRSRATPANVAAIMVTLGLVLPMIFYFAGNALADRTGGAEMGNSSWAERSSSMVIGLQLVFDGGIWTYLFGLGTGETAVLMQRLHGLEAVWSVTLTYLYESGVVGGIAMLLIGRALYRSWRDSGYDSVFAAIFFVWFVGITITTSYSQLLPIWIALGLMTMWNGIIAPADPMPLPIAARRRRASSNVSTASTPPVVATPSRRWSGQNLSTPPSRWRDQ